MYSIGSVLIPMASFGGLKTPFPKQVVVTTIGVGDLYFRQQEPVSSHALRHTGCARVPSLTTDAP